MLSFKYSSIVWSPLPYLWDSTWGKRSAGCKWRDCINSNIYLSERRKQVLLCRIPWQIWVLNSLVSPGSDGLYRNLRAQLPKVAKFQPIKRCFDNLKLRMCWALHCPSQALFCAGSGPSPQIRPTYALRINSWHICIRFLESVDTSLLIGWRLFNTSYYSPSVRFLALAWLTLSKLCPRASTTLRFRWSLFCYQYSIGTCLIQRARTVDWHAGSKHCEMVCSRFWKSNGWITDVGRLAL